MSRRLHLEAALLAWRNADRRLAAAVDGEAESLRAEVAYHRGEFHRLSGEHMAEQIDKLRGAERRRVDAMPSTVAYHQAAKDEKALAAEIWEEARISDEDIPGADAYRDSDS